MNIPYCRDESLVTYNMTTSCRASYIQTNAATSYIHHSQARAFRTFVAFMVRLNAVVYREDICSATWGNSVLFSLYNSYLYQSAQKLYYL